MHLPFKTLFLLPLLLLRIYIKDRKRPLINRIKILSIL